MVAAEETTQTENRDNIRVVADQNEFRVLIEEDNKTFEASGFLAMYEGRRNYIVKDPGLMVIPIHDRIVHRGHSVFDTACVMNGRLWGSRRHFTRFLASASKARIPLDKHYDENKLRRIALKLAAVAGARECEIRMFASGGVGSLGVLPVDSNEVSLYMVAQKKNVTALEKLLRDGIDEVTITTRDIPLKPQFLATMKTTDYMLNSLLCMKAVERGGKNGLMVQDDGYIAEGPTCGIMVLGTDGILRTVPFTDVLMSCTVRAILERVVDLVGKSNIKGALDFDPEYENHDFLQNPLVEDSRKIIQDAVKGVEQRPIQKEELYTAQELFWVSGDLTIEPINFLDGRTIGGENNHRVATAIWKILYAEACHSHTGTYVVNYDDI